VPSILMGMVRSGSVHSGEKLELIPQSETRSDHFERKRACLEAGYKAYERDERDLIGSGLHLFLPTFCYNDSLNTCLYACGVRKENYKSPFVRDCLTNMEILTFTMLDGRVVASDTDTEYGFELRKRKLMAGGAQ